MRAREGCRHGEVETNVSSGTISCRLCGVSAKLPYFPTVKHHKHKKAIFAGNGQSFWYCTDPSGCSWQKRVYLKNGLYRVCNPLVCAGFVVQGNKITDCAPILRKNIGYWIKIAVWICE